MRTPISEELLDTIAVKFIANLPDFEMTPDRIGFHFESAYFYYMDYFDLKSNKIKTQQEREQKQFCSLLLKATPRAELQYYTGQNISELIQENYFTIPINGVIILNPSKTKVVMVESVVRSILGFPKGKIRQGESSLDCAYREALEEVGVNVELDPQKYIDISYNFFSNHLNRSFTKPCRFYLTQLQENMLPCYEEKENIVPFVDDKNEQNPEQKMKVPLQVLLEIKSVKWYDIKRQICFGGEKKTLNGPTRLAYPKLLYKIKSPCIMDEVQKKAIKRERRNTECKKLQRQIKELRQI